MSGPCSIYKTTKEVVEDYGKLNKISKKQKQEMLEELFKQMKLEKK